MPVPTIDEVLADLNAKVEAGETVQDSAVAYIKGVPAMIAAAVAEAEANGGALNEAQAAAFQSLSDKIAAQTAETSAALTTNTPEDPNP